MPNTPGGTPYVDGSDLVASYPTVSLALANKVDTKANTTSPTVTNLSISGTDFNTSQMRENRFTADNDGAYFQLQKSRSATLNGQTVVVTGDRLGSIHFAGSDGSAFRAAAGLACFVDGTPGASDMPGRMVFFTVPDGSTTLTERARINNAGYFLINTTAPDAGGDAGFGRLAVRDNDDNTATVKAMASNASYAGRVFQAQATRAANTAYSFFLAQSDVNGTPDIEFNLRGDGSGFCDGAWTGGGADYAEYFEWADGNPDNEDRRGISVTLDGDKITPAKSGDIVIGVISSNPSVVGDAAYLRWTGKYLTDDYGSPIVENYEVYEWVETVMIDDEPHIVQHSYAFDQIPEGIKPPKDAKKTTQTRRTVNPQYDPNIVYVPREDRPEWATVGLMGKLRVRKGQQVAPHWVKMRDISDTVEEWLVK